MSVLDAAFALAYAPSIALAERAGMRELRARVLAGARGRVVELGAGAGHNLPHYPRAVERLALCEPVPEMAAQLARRARRLGVAATLHGAPAEGLPFADASVDTVVSTLVLCTVDDPARALAEVARVLRPGGALLFIEHVRAESPRLARRQRLLRRPWHAVAGGCHCDRPTLELIDGSPLELDGVERSLWRGMPSIVRPLAHGRALAPAGGAVGTAAAASAAAAGGGGSSG